MGLKPHNVLGTTGRSQSGFICGIGVFDLLYFRAPCLLILPRCSFHASKCQHLMDIHLPPVDKPPPPMSTHPPVSTHPPPMGTHQLMNIHQLSCKTSGPIQLMPHHLRLAVPTQHRYADIFFSQSFVNQLKSLLDQTAHSKGKAKAIAQDEPGPLIGQFNFPTSNALQWPSTSHLPV